MLNKKTTLNATETAEYIGVDRVTLYNMIKDGRFNVEPVKGTKPRRWNVDALDEWRSAQ